MGYSLIEGYSREAEVATVLIEGRTFEVPSLIEDSDGIRVYLGLMTPELDVPAEAWLKASASGASALLLWNPDHHYWAYSLAENFIESRLEDIVRRAYVYGHWQPWEHLDPPTYVQMVSDELGPVESQSKPKTNFVHLHTHTEFSTLDGLSKVEEIIEAVTADNNPAVASADHGNCAVHPSLQLAADKAGIKAIFGMEAYFVPDRHRRGKQWTEEIDGKEVQQSDAKEALNEYQHICLWAMDQSGLHNLWAASTEAYVEGFYGKPRLDWDTLGTYGDGLIASSGCLRGPLSQALLQGDEEKARTTLARFLDLFGDRFYIEIHTNHLDEQIKVNRALVALAREYDVPMIACVDSHYACKEDQHTHRAWLAMQTNKDLTDDTSLFAGGQNYHLATAAEVSEALAYLGEDVVRESMDNTVALADRCSARVEGASVTPIYSKGAESGHKRDQERAVDICLGNWERKIAGKSYEQQIAMTRFEYEGKMLSDKKFWGYFLMVWDYVSAAKNRDKLPEDVLKAVEALMPDDVEKKRTPILVGPSRGSGGGSLIAYLMDITEIDPVDTDLMFERFMTEGRIELPDFDIDFPASERAWITAYIIYRWGADFVARVGTVSRLQNKGAINDADRVLGNPVSFMDKKKVTEAIDVADKPLAGKHVSWDDFWGAADDELDGIRQRNAEAFDLAEHVVGRVKTYGKHAAGLVISTDKSLLEHLPMRVAADGSLVTQFDMDSLGALGYIKFDILTLRTLDTIQMCSDLVFTRYGIRVDIYNWRDQYLDPQVWETMSSGQTLGIFQVETRAVTRLTKRLKPQTLHDLAAVVTLVRPGPAKSGLTETYLRRRAGVEPVIFQEPRLESVLSGTFGCLIYQEDIMQTCMVLAGYSSNEADGVRKILGKKLVEKVAEAGNKFVSRAAECDTDPQVAAELWLQMAEFAKYSFNKAHAFAYAVLGYWTAWFKFHFPVEFLTAALSTVKAERIPEFITDLRRQGYAINLPDINQSEVGFSHDALSVRYGLVAIKGIGDDAAAQVVRLRPYSSFDDFMDRCVKIENSKVDMGHVKALVAVGALDCIVANRRALEVQLERESNGDATRCIHKDVEFLGMGGLPCHFDWDNEVDPPMVRRGRGKDAVSVVKDPPKKCTIKCRNYTKPPTLTADMVPAYTEIDIREREHELLGVWVSSTPFDRVDPEFRDIVNTVEEIEHGREGEYMVAAVVTRLSKKKDKRGDEYAWVSLQTEDGDLDSVIFASNYEKYKRDLSDGKLIYAKLWKTSRGTNIINLMPV